MSSCNTFPDTIGICETKLNKNSNIELISLKNYNLYFVNSETRSGGVLIYIKNSNSYSIRHDLKLTCSKFESLWLEISVEINIIYRHPGHSINKFSTKISTFFIENINKYKDI